MYECFNCGQLKVLSKLHVLLTSNLLPREVEKGIELAMHESMKSQPRLDKKRIDKTRLEGDSKGETISKALLKTWQSNLDAEEANKEIRQ